MKIHEILNEATDADSIKAMSLSDRFDYAKSLSQQELQTLVDGFSGFEMWHVAFTSTLEDIKSSERQSAPAEEFKIDPSTIFYRGTGSSKHGAKSRNDYATFVTDNPYQAASYAGPDGVVTAMTLHPDKAILFRSRNPNHHSFTEYDDRAMETGNGQALVAHNIQDSGYFTDGLAKSTLAKINVAFRDESIAKIKSNEPARKYFK